MNTSRKIGDAAHFLTFLSNDTQLKHLFSMNIFKVRKPDTTTQWFFYVAGTLSGGLFSAVFVGIIFGLKRYVSTYCRLQKPTSKTNF